VTVAICIAVIGANAQGAKNSICEFTFRCGDDPVMAAKDVVAVTVRNESDRNKLVCITGLSHTRINIRDEDGFEPKLTAAGKRWVESQTNFDFHARTKLGPGASLELIGPLRLSDLFKLTPGRYQLKVGYVQCMGQIGYESKWSTVDVGPQRGPWASRS